MDSIIVLQTNNKEINERLQYLFFWGNLKTTNCLYTRKELVFIK